MARVEVPELTVGGVLRAVAITGEHYRLQGVTGEPTTTLFQGSNSFTVPAGVTSLILQGIGNSGAGGGGAAGIVGSTTPQRGGGAGGAPLVQTIFAAVNPGSLITLTFPAAATGGVAGGDGQDGGDITVTQDGTLVLATFLGAKGGQGGNSVSAGPALGGSTSHAAGLAGIGKTPAMGPAFGGYGGSPDGPLGGTGSGAQGAGGNGFGAPLSVATGAPNGGVGGGLGATGGTNAGGCGGGGSGGGPGFPGGPGGHGGRPGGAGGAGSAAGAGAPGNNGTSANAFSGAGGGGGGAGGNGATAGGAASNGGNGSQGWVTVTLPG